MICIKNFGFALRLRTFVQKFLTWGHNPQPQPQTQPSDHGSWICILWSPPRGRSPLRRHHSMQIQDPWSDGCVCGCGCGLCPQVKNFCTKVLNLRAKPKFLMHITAFTSELAISTVGDSEAGLCFQPTAPRGVEASWMMVLDVLVTTNP